MSTRISAGVDDSLPLFHYFLLLWSLLIVKLQIFPYTCLFTFFSNNYIVLANSQVLIQKKGMTTNIIFVGATPID